MKYHDIKTCDMNNGEGLRVVLFVSGCERKCPGCQNPETWDRESGLTFGAEEVAEIYAELQEDYCAGLTLVGGEPLMSYNVPLLTELCKSVKEDFPNKTIWCYTGYTWDSPWHGAWKDKKKVRHLEIMKYIDVLLDGPFIQDLADEKLPWVGSSNQRVIDVQKSLKENNIILYNT